MELSIKNREPLTGLKKSGHQFGGGCLSLVFWPFLRKEKSVFGAKFGYFRFAKTSVFLAGFQGWESPQLRERAKASIDYYLYSAARDGNAPAAGGRLDQSVGIEEFSVDQDPLKDPLFLRISYDRARTNSQAILTELNKAGLRVELIQGPIDL